MEARSACFEQLKGLSIVDLMCQSNEISDLKSFLRHVNKYEVPQSQSQPITIIVCSLAIAARSRSLSFLFEAQFAFTIVDIA